MKSVVLVVGLYVVISFFHFSASAQIVTSQARNDGWALPLGELKVRLYGGQHSASSFYNHSDQLIALLSDPPVIIVDGGCNETSLRGYTVDFTGLTGGLYSEYGLLPNLTLVADIPATRWNIRERYSFDSTFLRDTANPTSCDSVHVRRDRAELSRFQPDYYGIGGRYAWTNDNNLVGISGMVRIPPGFKNKVALDSTGEFLEDEFYEALLGLNLGISFNKAWLASNINYNMRGGGYNDEMQYYLEFGTRNVETTQFVVFAKYIQSLGSFQNALTFDPRRRRFQENYFLAGGIFEIEFQKRLSVNAGYDIRLAGKDTWSLSTFSIGAGWRFSPEPKVQPSGF